MKNYLVTGGLGFIGSHLVSALLEDPQAQVTVVDNLMNKVFATDQLVEEICGDKPGKLEVQVLSVAEFTPQKSFDKIFHLASVVGPAAVLHYSGFITESIVRDTYKVIRLAQTHGAQLVNVSTSEVYGGGDRGFCQEETPRVFRGPASARQEYAAGKAACEVSIANLCSTGKLNAVTIRPFNVSGVRQLGQGGFVLPRFIGQAMQDLPLTVFGDGVQVRAFTDVRDIVSGILKVSEKGQNGEFYNVGNSANLITIRELAALVLQVTGSRSEIRLVDPKTLYGEHYEEAADKFPDASKVTGLGWQPRFPLDQTVKAVHEWFLGLPKELMLQASGLAPVSVVEPRDRSYRIDSKEADAVMVSSIQEGRCTTVTYKELPRQRGVPDGG
jgi:UDP-glucose 4-epimerase